MLLLLLLLLLLCNNVSDSYRTKKYNQEGKEEGFYAQTPGTQSSRDADQLNKSKPQEQRFTLAETSRPHQILLIL